MSTVMLHLMMDLEIHTQLKRGGAGTSPGTGQEPVRSLEARGLPEREEEEGAVSPQPLGCYDAFVQRLKLRLRLAYM